MFCICGSVLSLWAIVYFNWQFTVSDTFSYTLSVALRLKTPVCFLTSPWADWGEGLRGPRPPFFFLYFQNAFETLTLLYCCMSAFEGEGGGLGTLFLNFLELPLEPITLFYFSVKLNVTERTKKCNWKNKEKIKKWKNNKWDKLQIMFGFKKLLSDNKTETPWLPRQMNDQWHIAQRRNHCRGLEGVETEEEELAKHSAQLLSQLIQTESVRF